MTNDGYSDFQKSVFQEMQDKEDEATNPERRFWRFATKMGTYFGLTEVEVRSVYREGMREGELLDAMRAIRKR